MTDPVTIVGVAVLSAAGGAFGRTVIKNLWPGEKNTVPESGYSHKRCLDLHKITDNRLLALEIQQKNTAHALDELKDGSDQIHATTSNIAADVRMLLDRTAMTRKKGE